MYKKVDCLVVTYNRLDLLKQCLVSVNSQEYKLNNIIVVNNNSSDGTTTFLKKLSVHNPRLKIVNLKDNLGGAGGFNAGFKYFINESDGEYLWLMDDDAIPNKKTLLNLMNPVQKINDFGFLASDVRWIDDNPAKMNVPRLTKDWNNNLNLGLIGIKSASFVSLLIPRKVIQKVGYPIKEFFIWGDDMEYTTRLLRAGYKAYLVVNSQILHKIYKNIAPNIIKETNINRFNRYYFESRNIIYIFKKYYGFKGFLYELARYIYISLKLIFSKSKFKRKKLKFIIKGIFAGISFNPKVESVNYNKKKI